MTCMLTPGRNAGKKAAEAEEDRLVFDFFDIFKSIFLRPPGQSVAKIKGYGICRAKMTKTGKDEGRILLVVFQYHNKICWILSDVDMDTTSLLNYLLATDSKNRKSNGTEFAAKLRGVVLAGACPVTITDDSSPWNNKTNYIISLPDPELRADLFTDPSIYYPLAQALQKKDQGPHEPNGITFEVRDVSSVALPS